MSRSQTPLKTSAKLCKCGEFRPEAMTRSGRPPCYECMLVHRGRKPWEEYPFGRYNENVLKISVEIPGNWHRAFDTRRALRPEVLKRPGKNPLHQIAAVVVTVGEAVGAFTDYARRENWPEWTIKLAELLSNGAHANFLLASYPRWQA